MKFLVEKFLTSGASSVAQVFSQQQAEGGASSEDYVTLTEPLDWISEVMLVPAFSVL